MSKVAKSVSKAGSSGRGSRGALRKYKSATFSRRVVVKARIVRSAVSSARALQEHLRYISRDSALKGEDHGRVFDGLEGDVDRDQFAEAAKDDRHHFRLIVSPEDGKELQDLKPMVRDLVSQMERDLETRLECVAAVHDNTDHPHAHIVIRGKRDDGRDLVIPRAYISHTIRERAEELVTLELGPESKLERDIKHAKQVKAERLTQIDRTMVRLQDETGVIDLNHTPLRFRAVNAARLRKLKALGLATDLDQYRWKLSDGFQQTLKDLGERNDIIKQMHHSLGDRQDRIADPARPFSGAAGRVPVTGALLRKGMGGDGHDVPYVIVDSIDGRAVHCTVSNSEEVEGLSAGMIVTLHPPNTEPRPSDKTIAAISSKNDGIYSAALHQQSDLRSTPEFIRAHIRRLEALRRKRLVERSPNGEWHVPRDYLTKVREYQDRYAGIQGAKVDVVSWSDLGGQINASGLTWLDTMSPPRDVAQGFADDVRKASQDRRAILRNRGYLPDTECPLDEKSMKRLKREGVDWHGNKIAQKRGSEYRPLPQSGKIEGVYVESIKTPEGRFAVIDRGKTLTLVPWRRVMERVKGRSISVAVRGDRISWEISRSKGVGR